MGTSETQAPAPLISLRRLRRLIQAGTQLPWREETDPGTGRRSPDWRVVAAIRGPIVARVGRALDAQVRADAALIAGAANALPTLLELAEAALAETAAEQALMAATSEIEREEALARLAAARQTRGRASSLLAD